MFRVTEGRSEHCFDLETRKIELIKSNLKSFRRREGAHLWHTQNKFKEQGSNSDLLFIGVTLSLYSLSPKITIFVKNNLFNHK